MMRFVTDTYWLKWGELGWDKVGWKVKFCSVCNITNVVIVYNWWSDEYQEPNVDYSLEIHEVTKTILPEDALFYAL